MNPSPVLSTHKCLNFHEFQIAKHWSVNLVPKMNTEKLQLLATSYILGTEKEVILCIWNSSKSTRVANWFLVSPFSDTNFAIYLHEYVFLYQLKTVVLGQLPSLLDEVRCSDKQPSRSLF